MNDIAKPPGEALCGAVVTGHGLFASGLISALELIMGPQEGLVAVDFPRSDTATELKQHLSDAFDSFPATSRVAVFCDLRGGSPFNEATSLSSKRHGVNVLYGANLPTLIQFVSRRKTADTEAVVTAALHAGAVGLGQLTAAASPTTSMHDDWD